MPNAFQMYMYHKILAKNDKCKDNAEPRNAMDTLPDPFWMIPLWLCGLNSIGAQIAGVFLGCARVHFACGAPQVGKQETQQETCLPC